jgi:MoaA/NifB/PqqE/SkfB family radical SAM enzyme
MLVNFNTLREMQSHGVTDLLSTLRVVEINPIDACNRSCSFCPRSIKEYSANKIKLSLDTIKKIATDLQEISFDGRISFAGFGEPTLYKHLIESISIIRSTVPTAKYIEIITNGDLLTKPMVAELETAGCTNVTISMYDYDKTAIIAPLFENTSIQLTLKDSYNGFAMVNRTEIFSESATLYKQKECYLPFYKMFIDTDGNVILCANDWKRTSIIGNVLDETIQAIWLGEGYKQYRQHLLQQTRDLIPCKFCNIDGTLYGRASFIKWSTND